MKLPEGIKVDPEIMMGKPCVKGTRIPVYVLLQKMAAGETEAELMKAYPHSWSHLAANSTANRSKYSVDSCKMALQAPRD